MNWITKNFSSFINDGLKGAVDFFSSWLQTFFDKDIEIMNAKELSSAVMMTSSIAVVLVIFLTFKRIFNTYVIETEGDPDQDPIQMLVLPSITLALISSNNFLYNTLQNLSKAFTSDIVGSVSAQQFTVKLSSALKQLADPTPKIFIIMIVLGTCFICVLVFSFEAAFRGAELLLMKVLFPIFALDKISANTERWNAFITAYMVTFFGYSFQLLFVRLGINRVIAGMSEGISAEFNNYFLGIVCLWFAIKTPKWLEKFVYKSGIGQVAGNGLRTATFMLPSIIMRR